MKEKNAKMKETIEMIKPKNTYEKNNNKNTIPKVLISNQEKKIKEEPIQKVDNLRQIRRINSITVDRVNSAVHRLGTQHINVQRAGTNMQ